MKNSRFIRDRLSMVVYATVLLIAIQCQAAIAAVTVAFSAERSELLCFHGRTLSALDAKTGRILWRQNLPAIIDSSPVVLGRILVWAGNETRYVYGFDLRARKQLWKTPGRSTVLAPGPNGSILANAEGFAAIRSIDSSNGRELWRHKGRSREYIKLIVAADAKAVTDQYIVDASDGKEMKLRLHYPLIALAGMGDLVISLDAAGRLQATDGGNLTALWSKDMFGPTVAASIALSKAGMAVLRYGGYPFTSETGDLFVLDAFSGAIRWKRSVGGEGRKLPADMLEMDDLYLYLTAPAATGSILHAIDVASGKSVWSVENGHGFFGLPLSVAGRVYVASRTDTVYCLNRKDGSQLWSTSLKQQKDSD